MILFAPTCCITLLCYRRSDSARYSKLPLTLREDTPTIRDDVLTVCDDESEGSEGVAFVDTESSTMTKNSSSDTSTSPQSSNALYYLFVLCLFTITGLFCAFLFYKIP